MKTIIKIYEVSATTKADEPTAYTFEGDSLVSLEEHEGCRELLQAVHDKTGTVLLVFPLKSFISLHVAAVKEE